MADIIARRNDPLSALPIGQRFAMLRHCRWRVSAHVVADPVRNTKPNSLRRHRRK
jgi:hypothetical protein